MKQQAKFQNHIWLVKIDAMDGSQEKIISTRKCLSKNEGQCGLKGALALWISHGNTGNLNSLWHTIQVIHPCSNCMHLMPWLHRHMAVWPYPPTKRIRIKYTLGDYRNFVRALPCIHSYLHDCKTNVRTVVDMSYCSKERQHNICNDHPYS